MNPTDAACADVQAYLDRKRMIELIGKFIEDRTKRIVTRAQYADDYRREIRLAERAAVILKRGMQ